MPYRATGEVKAEDLEMPAAAALVPLRTGDVYPFLVLPPAPPS